MFFSNEEAMAPISSIAILRYLNMCRRTRSYMGAISLKSCCLSAAASAVRAPGAPGRRDSEEDEEDDEEEEDEDAAAATQGLSAKELEGPVVRRRGEARE